ncbi:NAD(P)H-quinone oxidoreductase [Tropicimonas sp. IMCC34043]|uniref:NAD(P)H-quinone oxidoreductase n=1 Tax=Tropicimonas sp. IMCC34043 TaxID=2248760 RepID=UPI000E2262C6|nr:NAD(P)H-quinone oxidoreductase [Tropicimonas sp. IMCC34043]
MTPPPLPALMTVVEIGTPGGPEALQVAKRPLPVPAADEVLIRVTAAGVNGPDLMQRSGLYPPPKGASDLPGLEVSGEIVAVGAGQTLWALGDRVCALTNGGGYAEYVAVNAGHCLPIPDGVTEIDAAGLPETFFTVWSNIFHGHELARDSLLLVHGGSGGIGSAAVQLGAAMGLRVFATVGSDPAADFASSLGALRAIDYHREDFVEICREAGGADVILDIVGGSYVGRNLRAAAPDGRIIQLAFRQGSKVEVDLMPVMLKRLILTGSTLRPRPPAFKAAVAADLRQTAWPMFADGRLRSVTHAVLPLAEAAEAHRQMEAGGHHGKILLTP